MKKLIWITLLLLTGLYLIPASSSNSDLLSKNDAEANEWEVIEVGKMSVDRAAHQATLLKNGQVLITGGCARSGCERILSSAELYDPASESFKPASSMSVSRSSHTAVMLSDGRVLVAGGWTGTKTTNSAEIYDPSTDQWEVVDSMSDARASLISIFLPDSTVFIMGGGDGGLGDLTSVENFNPSTANFVAMGESRSNHYLGTLLEDGRVLMTGGQDKNDQIHNSTEIYDPATGEFQETGSMEKPRVKQAAVRMNDGRVMVIGGSDSRGYRGRYSSTEIYDPATGEFSPGPEMNFGRHKIRDAAVKLPSGNILVAGGADKPEIFDINTQEFRTVSGQLSGPQMFATATLLSNGDVLILGGYDDRIRTSNTAWMVRSAN